MMPSKALEVNIATSRVQVTVDPKYQVLEKVLSKYYGIRESLKTFQEELCHPYRNWEFIVREARSYALNYFHDIKAHAEGPATAALFAEIFFEAMEGSSREDVRRDAADNLLLFIRRMVRDGGEALPRFMFALDHVFGRIRESNEAQFLLFVKSYYQMDRIGSGLFQALPAGADFTAVNRLLMRYYAFTFNYWLSQADPLETFLKETGSSMNRDDLDGIFSPISHQSIKDRLITLQKYQGASDINSRELLGKLIAFPGYGQIVTLYGRIPQKIGATGRDGNDNQCRLIFLLQIMDIPGLSAIHEETLRDINRTLGRLIRSEDPQVIHGSIEKTFHMLRMSAGKFPGTALNCVLNMGKGVYKTDDSDLVDFFIDSVVSLGFQSPKIKGVGHNWQIRVNPSHIHNIRIWLSLVKMNPKWSKKLLSFLIINLSLTGVFIKDTDLFPRDISELLNSDLSPVYNLVKQLARLFPAFFNDIGAEGRLRDISTDIDEICGRNDVLIHFLRKQSHVESSNQIIGLIEAALDFWRTKNKEGVKDFVPPDIYDRIETSGPYVDGVHEIVSSLFKQKKMTVMTDLLTMEKGRIEKIKGMSSGIPSHDYERVSLAIELYRLLFQKYHLRFTETDAYLSRLNGSGLPDLKKLKRILNRKKATSRIRGLLDYLETLKGVILSPATYEIREDIYRKRHFTVDIPSMYGSYHEMKFDALGLTFRLESLINILFDELVDAFNTDVITRATISKAYEYLCLFDRMLKLDGIISTEMERQLDILAHALEVGSFSATQYLDIFRGFSQVVGNIVNDYFNNVHQENLKKVLEMTPVSLLMTRFMSDKETELEKLDHRVMEIFLRDRIACSPGLQQLDLLLGRISRTLYRQLKELPKESLQMLLGVDPQKTITPIFPTRKGLMDIIHLGNKGLNLAKMEQYGLPVPPGFIITTEVFRTREIIDQYPPAAENLEKQVNLEIARVEKVTGKTYGHPKNPLLFSVRSGSAMSQPGMMDTFLDVGVNEKIVDGLIAMTRNKWFGWDTYRRFLQSYGMAFGMLRDDFDALIQQTKQKTGIQYKKDFSGEQMREVAMMYKTLILDRGFHIETAPRAQLRVAISRVLDSWESAKAKTYRRIMGISDDWGTAVTVQAMAFGNYSPDSGAGVFFTHNPRWSGDMILLWGDFTCGNQGEDVVSGLVSTLPISRRQAEIENRPAALTLENRFPDIYRTMRDWAKILVYEKEWSPQEMEFTFESPETTSLYFLQTRDMVIRQRRSAYSFEFSEKRGQTLLDHGIGVSGGAMTGRLVFSLEEIRHWRKREPNTSLVIVRSDTVPDDIKEIYEADGLLTARGGSTSHAAIVAYRLKKTCVVGCANLVCNEKEGKCVFGEKELHSGEWISLDGLEGSVYAGKMNIRQTGG